MFIKADKSSPEEIVKDTDFFEKMDQMSLEFVEDKLINVDENKEIARGLVNYSGDEVRKVKGLRTSLIKKALGYKPYDEIIHRDNIVML